MIKSKIFKDKATLKVLTVNEVGEKKYVQTIQLTSCNIQENQEEKLNDLGMVYVPKYIVYTLAKENIIAKLKNKGLENYDIEINSVGGVIYNNVQEKVTKTIFARSAFRSFYMFELHAGERG